MDDYDERIKALEKIIEDLKESVEYLESRVDDLESQIDNDGDTGGVPVGDTGGVPEEKIHLYSVRINNQEKGPFGIYELSHMLEKKEIPDDCSIRVVEEDECRVVGEDEWTPIRKIPRFDQLIVSRFEREKLEQETQKVGGSCEKCTFAEETKTQYGSKYWMCNKLSIPINYDSGKCLSYHEG